MVPPPTVPLNRETVVGLWGRHDINITVARRAFGLGTAAFSGVLIGGVMTGAHSACAAFLRAISAIVAIFAGVAGTSANAGCSERGCREGSSDCYR
jgi:hypothetical protein